MPDRDAMPVSTIGVGLFDRSDRVRVRVEGPDRAKFLHNLTTNDVKRLAVGRGCEAFVTSLQGKTIGFVTLLAAEDHILVRSDPGGMELALPHFQKYGVFDDVDIEDRTAFTFELHLAGGDAEGLLRRLGGPIPDEPDLAHQAGELAGCPVWGVREAPTGYPGLTVIGHRDDRAKVLEALKSEGGANLNEKDAATFEAVRIEAGTPVFGQDVTEKNLPQEFARDDRAISFVKGCYLGQETVARLDALGHVNQLLKGLAFAPEAGIPEPGTNLEADGKKVGTITSSAHSPWRGHAVALAMIRTTHARDGVTLTLAGSDAVATVHDLPFVA